MEIIRISLQVFIAIAIFNVWLLRQGKSTPYRGGNASNMKEEFEAYGLPYWFMLVIGGLKLVLAVLLIFGIWYQPVIQTAAIAMAVLMLGAIAMHVKVKDPVSRAAPATVMLLLSLFVALA